MATETTDTPTTQQPPDQTASALKPAVEAPSLLGGRSDGGEPAKVEMPAGFEGGADAWGKLDDADKTAAITAATEKAKTDSVARVETFTKAEGKDARVAAFRALTKDERVEAFKGLSDEQKAELGITDPARPLYGDFNMPEGVTIDADGLKEATDLFADSGLSQEQAQKFIDLATKREQAVAGAGLKAFVDVQNKWVSEITNDPDVGGDKLQASKAAAGRAIDRLGGDTLRDAMNLTGAGNNPVIFKAFVQLGQWLSEDKFRPSAPAAPEAPKSPAQVIYGDGGPKQSVDA